MTPRIRWALWLLALAVLSPAPAPAVDQVPAAGQIVRRSRLDIDVWVNKDEGGVYRPGESMRIYFRTNAGAYVLLYNIDTDGYIHLIYPYGPGDRPFVNAGSTVAIPSRSDPYELAADGPPGVEYVVALASPVPFRNLPWFLSDAADAQAPGGDAEDEEDAGYIVGDPYVGMERLNQRLIPPGREDAVASSDTYFYIDRRVDYPRYVCADCHYHQPFFDPYVSVCPIVDIHIDATWVHYAPVRIGLVRPRYYYIVRSTAPPRYRQWKEQWSSRDGMTTLRDRFVVGGDTKARRQQWLKDRPRAREYFDLRRYRPGRVWQGRDQVLRLRERRQEQQRRREDVSGRTRGSGQRGVYDGQRPHERRSWDGGADYRERLQQRERGDTPPEQQNRPSVRDRSEPRQRAEPPPARGRPEVRPRDDKSQGRGDRAKQEERKEEKSKARDEEKSKARDRKR